MHLNSFSVSCVPDGGAVLISSVAGDGLALAQSLDDFKRADGVKGCPGIPYPELARPCMDTMVDVNESCKVVKWSCRDGNLQSIRTNTQIAQDIARDIESKENALRTEERKRLVRNFAAGRSSVCSSSSLCMANLKMLRKLAIRHAYVAKVIRGYRTSPGG